ncbi:uncharacterized protein DUF3858 [Nonlabens xylanidelens]|uniref:Uncharacterized protein DUF3858 n=1 Tax=Nonlabens xylanidelens TaxID=191564 RepID=A0A2S6ISN6_9FLAO|nr:DUF3857 domain-containing protein [Nonlabens xylanidelens]PPK97056.1 uncharacterized protein DUF3858 [Nonlabens xylanidelens]PQJ13741.1 hypothetical protein BST94_15485 [Nonlabens xylanidelens]
MKKLLLLFVFCLSISHTLKAQDIEYQSSQNIPAELLKNANAVIRKNNISIVIKDFDDVEVTTDRVVTVLNKKGLSDINAAESYDEDTKVDEIEATIYDAVGNKVVRIKEKDFKDVSAVSNGTLYSDNRVKYLDYTPRDYPFTIHFTSTVEYSTTAFLPSWVPLEYFYVSTQSSNYQVINNSGIEVKFKESHLDDYAITKNGNLNYTATNLTALVPQAYSPGFDTYGPIVKIAMKEFNMKGVAGVNNDWKDFGKWMNDELLSDVGELPKEVIDEVKTLTKDAKSQREKAKIVYEFMQERSRYISVQVGIGGWKPIDAMSVHNVAYGDCKGLSNYTKALLNEVGIESHHAIIYGDSNIRSVDKSFSSTQGNHMILYVPQLDDEKNIWLECTSKTNPFGYIAGWTDDRDALVVSDAGGEILHTTVYETKGNLQKSKAQVKLKADGSLTATIKQEVNGYQYFFKDKLDNYSNKEVISYYNNYWNHLNGISIIDHKFINNKDAVVYSEELELNVNKYSSKAGDLILFQPVVFNRNTNVPKKVQDRKLGFEIDRGYIDKDHYIIEIPMEYQIDVLPKIIDIENKFGKYSLKVELTKDGIVQVKRELKMNKGKFSAADYEAYRSFRKKISKADQSKGVIKIKK